MRQLRLPRAFRLPRWDFPAGDPRHAAPGPGRAARARHRRARRVHPRLQEQPGLLSAGHQRERRDGFQRSSSGCDRRSPSLFPTFRAVQWLARFRSQRNLSWWCAKSSSMSISSTSSPKKAAEPSSRREGRNRGMGRRENDGPLEERRAAGAAPTDVTPAKTWPMPEKLATTSPTPRTTHRAALPAGRAHPPCQSARRPAAGDDLQQAITNRHRLLRAAASTKNRGDSREGHHVHTVFAPIWNGSSSSCSRPGSDRRHSMV